ncbi:MAG: hypothetical protein NVSMB55_28660 [Mycobacteriales bacterium]
MSATKRYAAGRARALGVPTRGTTAPNRLRRVDRWLLALHGERIRRAPIPLVIDLGYGSSPVTALELHARLRQVRPDVHVLGLEIDPERVASARAAERPGLQFAVGGFELAGQRPIVVRAFNVLRQYEEEAANRAWAAMTSALAVGGVLVEGTCDEIGRRATWVELNQSGPRTLTLAAHWPTLGRPSELAERLPKCLIHHNSRGTAIHRLLSALDDSWERAAPYRPFGNRQRWVAALQMLDHPKDLRRARFGEVTVPWESICP